MISHILISGPLGSFVDFLIRPFLSALVDLFPALQPMHQQVMAILI